MAIPVSNLTLKEIAQHHNVQQAQLVLEISDLHINQIAVDAIDNWLNYAEALQLKPHQIQDIKTDNELTYLMKIQKVSIYTEQGISIPFRERRVLYVHAHLNLWIVRGERWLLVLEW